MKIKLDRVKLEEKDVLYRLLQYSLFEESRTDGNEMNENAIFEYKYFDKYFEDNTRDAFIVRDIENSKILGFVMINTYVQKVKSGHSIAEFMIVPKYRREKIGSKVAVECFNLYKGDWEVSPSFESRSAYLFWKSVIDKYTNKNNKYEDRIFIFNNENMF